MVTFYSGRCAQWLPEIRYFLPRTTPIVLVEVSSGRNEVISSEEGSLVAKQLRASFVKRLQGGPGAAVLALARAAFKHKCEREVFHGLRSIFAYRDGMLMWTGAM